MLLSLPAAGDRARCRAAGMLFLFRRLGDATPRLDDRRKHRSISSMGRVSLRTSYVWMSRKRSFEPRAQCGIRVTPPVCACILKRVCPQSHLSITVGRVTAPVCAQALRTGDSAGAVYCSHPRGLCCVRVPCSVGTWECPVRAGVTVSPEANLAFVRFWALSLAITVSIRCPLPPTAAESVC